MVVVGKCFPLSGCCGGVVEAAWVVVEAVVRVVVKWAGGRGPSHDLRVGRGMGPCPLVAGIGVVHQVPGKTKHGQKFSKE